MLWHDFKALLGALGLSEQALHIYGGVIVYALALKLSRRPPADLLPLVVVLFAALLNEGQDLKNAVDWRKTLELTEGIGDVVNTILLPACYTFWSRHRRRREASPPPPEPAPVHASPP
ncbi:MAG TPA: hypothetical protein VF589_10950 [Allosphingosinicella sp.]|jgi:hypothetical protein